MSSQFTFELNEDGVTCVVYCEDSITETNRGGLKDMKKTRNSNWTHHPVRLIEKYINLLPKDGAKPNFYLQSLCKTKPSCWYSTIPVGINKLRKVVGFLTDHSLRCATRLFQAGQDVKIVKKVMGHISHVVHKYQCTSNEQK